MKKISRILSTFVFCFLFWLFFTESFDVEELVVGAIISLIIATYSARFFIKENPFWLFNPSRLGALLIFIPIYAVELLKANIDVAIRALSPKLKVNPGIVKIETELKSDYGLSMLANCITLTPGTITMDIVEEKNKCYMYIHWIDVASKDVLDASNKIKGAFEPWVRRIFK